MSNTYSIDKIILWINAIKYDYAITLRKDEIDDYRKVYSAMKGDER